MSYAAPTRLLAAGRRRWSDIAAREGRIAATRALFAALWGFARDSTPARLRQLYGDADYDWEHRVNTTSAAISWRDRLLGVFHSPYQPTEPALFSEMIQSLQNHALQNHALPGQTSFDFRDFTFLDLGSGKGRTLLMASNYPFRRVVGVELLPALHQIAQENLRQYKSEMQKCSAIECVCADASTFPIPDEPLVMYLFNPLPEAGLRQVIANLERSLRVHPRALYVLYHNPLLENVVSENAVLRKIGGTHQYSIFEFDRR